MARLPVRHVAVVEQAEEVADAETLDALFELLPDRLGAARDDEALVHELLPRQVLEDLLARLRELRQRAVLHGRHRAVAPRSRWSPPSTANASSLAHAFTISSCASRYLSRVSAGICP